MILEIFNSTGSYMYLTNWNLESLLPAVVGSIVGSIIGASIGALLITRLGERNRRKRDLFVKLNEKFYGPWMFELKAGYELKRIIFDRARAEPKIGYVIPYSGFTGDAYHIKYLIEEIEIIFGINEWLKKDVKKNVLEEWEDFKKNFSDYEKKCASFFEKIKKRATERAQLPFDVNSKLTKDNKCIGPSFIEHIYNKLVLEVSGEEEPHYRGSSCEPSIEKLDGGIYELRCVETSLYSYFYAQGSEEEMKKCKNIFKELVDYSEYITKAGRLTKKAKEIEKKIKLLRDKIGEIMDLGKL